MDPGIEERFQTLERHVEFEKKLRSLDKELDVIRKRGFLQQTGAVVLVGVITALLSLWGSLERVKLDEKIAATEATLKSVQQKHEKDLENIRVQHEAALASRRDATENRRTDVEIFKQLTPVLIASKPDETRRALAIVGALDTDFWRPIAESFRLDETQGKLVQQIDKTRRDRYQGAGVSCDRASHRTTDRLSAADRIEARSFCRTVTVVDHHGATEPYKWPEGTGVSFNTGHRIGNEQVWCSCAFQS